MQSQRGPVHLFDLCLRCDHLGMALALAAHGVPGCVWEDHHLGPFCTDPSVPRDRWLCACQGWNTCPYCGWAFPVDQGIWMEDWDVEFIYNDWHDEDKRTWGAIPAAQEAAATPLTRAILDMCSCDMELPFSGSPTAMARLLDIAILTGNQKATVNLAKKCQLRPLRRWKINLQSEDCCWKAARAALWAGADFQDLMVKDHSSGEEVPFSQTLFLLSKLEDWQEIRHLLPRCHLWRPRHWDNWLGELFFERRYGRKLSLGKIRSAEYAGVDLRYLSVQVCNDEAYAPVTLLDVAIWCGQRDCAKACVDGGIELEGDDMTLAWHKGGGSLRLRMDDPPLNDVPSEVQIAAASAGRAWMKRSWQSEASQKGIALYQVMLKMSKGRAFPMVLVQEALSYSMPCPKIIDQLDLRAHVSDWMAIIWGRPASVHAATDCNTANVEEPEGMRDNHEAGTLLYIEVLVFVSIVCCQGSG